MGIRIATAPVGPRNDGEGTAHRPFPTIWVVGAIHESPFWTVREAGPYKGDYGSFGAALAADSRHPVGASVAHLRDREPIPYKKRACG